ncbi:MAG: hypothetical protein KDC66_21140 [Phaeodactylibacter sp.]|nr:hypothetical protein [Phaeodactylibacter sp.]
MNGTFHSFVLACCITLMASSAAGSSPDTLRAGALQPFGRYAFTDAGKLELISSASHFGFTFRGRVCRILAHLAGDGEHNYLQYELDGAYQKRIRLTGKHSVAITITAPGGGAHTIWVYKATEAHTGPIYIDAIAGKKLRPLKRREAPLIEFIGNSITCGAAADDSEVPCGAGAYHDQHNAYFAYGPRIARALGANFMLSSVSGIGMYRNWNSDGPAMPQVYETTDFQEGRARPWDFSRYAPAIVSIALGTNDFSMGDGKKERAPFDADAFVSRYIEFAELVKSKYPHAQLALLNSPVVAGAQDELLRKCLTAVKQSIDARHPADKPVALLFVEPMKARGCTGHPNVEGHGILAAELAPMFGALLQPDH